jgi:hypothetical protein
MRQRTLGILAVVLMVSGVGLGAGTMAFAIGGQGTVATFPGPDGQGNGRQILNPGPLGPGLRKPGPGFGQPGPGFGQQGPTGQRPPWDQPEPSVPAPQQ